MGHKTRKIHLDFCPELGYDVEHRQREPTAMLNVLSDGPFRYIHWGPTCELILTVVRQSNGKFIEFEGENEPVFHTLSYWKVIARIRASKSGLS